MRKLFFPILILLLSFQSGFSQDEVKPVKNIILMISDGTSLDVLSASRWLKTYRGEGDKLNVDPYLCGTVTTFSSNAPIGDSAPTTSCYMTGIPEQAGNVSIYPVSDRGNDLVPLDSSMAYQPLTTLLEAMKWEQGKATGLVVTCEFPHATPADCAAHYYNRSNYNAIAPQMAFNNLNVMFGGGNNNVSPTMKKHFQETGTAFFSNDKKGMMSYDGDKVWALFAPEDLPYDIDRDTTQVPSLAQMTEKAIQILDKDKNGFFMMVEGSKVDWAAHANDPIGVMTEFLAFDKAVGKAIDFAKKDGNTLVIITADHGNSGFSIGKDVLPKAYTKMTLNDLFGTVSQFKTTAEGLEKVLKNTKPENFKAVVKAETGIELTDDEFNILQASLGNKEGGDYMEVAKGKSFRHYLSELLNSKTPFGFTTHGHTGEEVFLAAYNPNGELPLGNRRNTELHKYMYQASGLKASLADFTKEKYAKHTDVFKGYKYEIDASKEGEDAALTVKKGRKTLIIPAFSSIALLNGKEVDMGSVAIYVDKNNTFYVDRDLAGLLK